jgi:tripartite motif-containing protein 71
MAYDINDAGQVVGVIETSLTAIATPTTDPGCFLGAWGSEGSGAGQFVLPSDVAVAPDGTIYVADSGNNRIQSFDAAGTYLGQWGGEGSGAGQFIHPLGVAVTPDGRAVYVADTDNDRIQVFCVTARTAGERSGGVDG